MPTLGEHGRQPTFLVGTDTQRATLDNFQKREQYFTEDYQKNKPLCFNAQTHQKTHPGKMRKDKQGRLPRDADATIVCPMLLGVADGVSQLEDFGIDASELPHELLKVCENLGMLQLAPDESVPKRGVYKGPISLLKQAYEMTESLGSTTILLSLLDNSTKIHGKLHPMIAVLTIGDCELLLLRRLQGRDSALTAVFHTEMQRIDGHVQTPLQLARVDERVDPDFDEDIALEVIERGSAVHCVSTYEGDIVLMGSDGVFDNLFLDELVNICNDHMPPAEDGQFMASSPALLSQISQEIIARAHAKTNVDEFNQLPDTPIGQGGKMDDTSIVVAEVVEWTETHNQILQEVRGRSMCGPGGRSMCGPVGPCRMCVAPWGIDQHELEDKDASKQYDYDAEEEEEDESNCKMS